MKFSCGENWDVQKKRLQDWHPFFALLPRAVGVDENGNDVCVWLGWIERKGTRVKRMALRYPVLIEVWVWEYRAKP